MTLIEPSVHITACTDSKCSIGALTFLEHCERTIYYESERKEEPEQFIEYIIKNGHEGILEHWNASLEIVCSISIARELFRCRLASFSCSDVIKVGKYGISFIVPKCVENNDGFYTHLEECELFYRYLLEKGIPEQYAREVLPLCTATQFIMTANLREWRHILKQRLGKGAHPEMKKLARLIYDELTSVVDKVFFSDIEELKIND